MDDATPAPDIDRRPVPQRALAVLRAAMAGELKAGLLGGGGLPYDGVQTVRIGDWRVRLFIDAGALDYVDGLTAPDGRSWGFAEVGSALDGLDPGARRDLERWLDRVEPWH